MTYSVLGALNLSSPAAAESRRFSSGLIFIAIARKTLKREIPCGPNVQNKYGINNSY